MIVKDIKNIESKGHVSFYLLKNISQIKIKKLNEKNSKTKKII